MARPKSIKDGKATNLLIASEVKSKASRAAFQRYGISLNELVNRLLAREVAHPTGYCRFRPRSLTVGQA